MPTVNGVRNQNGTLRMPHLQQQPDLPNAEAGDAPVIVQQWNSCKCNSRPSRIPCHSRQTDCVGFWYHARKPPSTAVN